MVESVHEFTSMMYKKPNIVCILILCNKAKNNEYIFISLLPTRFFLLEVNDLFELLRMLTAILAPTMFKFVVFSFCLKRRRTFAIIAINLNSSYLTNRGVEKTLKT